VFVRPTDELEGKNGRIKRECQWQRRRKRSAFLYAFGIRSDSGNLGPFVSNSVELNPKIVCWYSAVSGKHRNRQAGKTQTWIDDGGSRNVESGSWKTEMESDSRWRRSGDGEGKTGDQGGERSTQSIHHAVVHRGRLRRVLGPVPVRIRRQPGQTGSGFRRSLFGNVLAGVHQLWPQPVHVRFQFGRFPQGGGPYCQMPLLQPVRTYRRTVYWDYLVLKRSISL